MHPDTQAQPLTIVSEKYDGRPHVEWEADLIGEDERGLVALAPFGTELIHHTRGLRLPQDHHCLSLFPRDRWWNAMLDFDANGQFLSAYCNVARPYRREGQFVPWLDLDLDVLLKRDSPPKSSTRMSWRSTRGTLVTPPRQSPWRATPPPSFSIRRVAVRSRSATGHWMKR